MAPCLLYVSSTTNDDPAHGPNVEEGTMNVSILRTALLLVLGGGVAAACTISAKSDFEGAGNKQSAGGSDASSGPGDFTGQSTGSGPGNCNASSGDDFDGDGFTGDQGDCNDCDPNVSPGAIEVATDFSNPDAIEADENCNGEVDELVPTCDTGFGLTEFDPINAAAALGLCDQASEKGQGIVSATWVRANGAPATNATKHVGVFSTFGSNVAARAGDTMLALSSGYARIPGQPDECDGVSCGDLGIGNAPPGFPQDVPGCTGDTEINDDVGLELVLKAPTNATGLQYEFTFYSHEYPEFVCTMFNDQYVAIVDPAPQGSINGNISFDAANNPVSINIALFDVCEGCASGTNELLGTGFDTWGGSIDDSGATGWLVTTAPVEPGSEFTIRFAIWDTGDTWYDSTVLLDNFSWIANGGTVVVGTEQVPQ